MLRRLFTCIGIVVSAHAFTSPLKTSQLAAGLDFGTSGVRISVLDDMRTQRYESSLTWQHSNAVKDAEHWIKTMADLLHGIPSSIAEQLASIAIDATSASCLVVDRHHGRVIRSPRLYNYCCTGDAARRAQAALRRHAPAKHTTLSQTSTLMKCITWHVEEPYSQAEVLVHQADYVAAHLMHDGNSAGSLFPRISDWNNILKLGYDLSKQSYPAWFQTLGQEIGLQLETVLPNKVVEPGSRMGPVSPSVIEKYHLHPACEVVGGTTDSIAAFLASGASTPGQAVTSLGSTMAVKLLSHRPVEDAVRGVYSHKLGDLWLVGGASNVGCAALKEQGYEEKELASLSERIDPRRDLDVHYYPLTGNNGERFPVCDPEKEAVLDPRLKDRAEFLHGILQGIAYVEKEGYDTLKELGAEPLQEVITAGGGSKNAAWTVMRQRILQVPVSKAPNTDAAYGAALLALKGLQARQARLLA